jgi:hypothetical protein
MRIRIFAVLATAMLAGIALAPPASAKTIKACQKEWQADKTAMQAAGKTEKAYVADCKGKPADSTAATKPSKSPKEDKGGY